MNYQQLKEEYDKLVAEEKEIPDKINSLLTEISPLEKQIADLRNQAQELDLQISELPPQVYEKQCNTMLFIKSCGEVPVPNPEIGRLTEQRNNLIRQSNDLQLQVNNKYKQITELSDRLIQIKKREIEIKDQLNTELQQLVAQPVDILGFLLGKKQPLSLEQYQQIQQTQEKPEEKPSALKYLPILAVGGLGIFLLTKKIKKKEE
jgi:uncharacterized coiled-coil DUF342 family protein